MSRFISNFARLLLLFLCAVSFLSSCAARYTGRYVGLNTPQASHFFVLEKDGDIYFKSFWDIGGFCFAKGRWHAQKGILHIQGVRFIYANGQNLEELTAYSETTPQRVQTTFKIRMQDFFKDVPFRPEKFRVFVHDTVPAIFSWRDSTYQLGAGKIDKIIIFYEDYGISELDIPSDKQDYAHITFIWEKAWVAMPCYHIDAKWLISCRKMRTLDKRISYKKRRRMLFF